MKPEKSYLAPEIELIFMSKDVVRTSGGGSVVTTATDLTDTDGYSDWAGDGWSRSVGGNG